MKPLLLRLHRWTTLVMALPWLVIMLTGLVLSFEPILMDSAFTGNTLPLVKVQAAMAKHDPSSKATILNVRAFDDILILQESRTAPPIRVDLKTGELVAGDTLRSSSVFSVARRMHETLLLDLAWFVDAATIVLLVSLAFGILMGLPRLQNSVGGWHRVTAWVSLPLLILLPLTGLALAYGIAFAPPLVKVPGPPVKLVEAVGMVAAQHDLASVYWIRPQAGATRARVHVSGEARIVTVTPEGLILARQTWPRALHEGSWAGGWSGALNALVSVVFLGLMATGLWMWWTRRAMRIRMRQRVARVPAQQGS